MPSEYDFGLEKAGSLPHFDPERIAEQAVWPAVNHLWRGEWRNDTFAGHEFVFPGRGVGLHEDTIFDVVLSADCYGVTDAMESSDNYPGLLAKAGITYSFDTDEEAEISAFQSVEDQQGTVIWVSDRFDEHEIEEMGDEDEVDEILFDVDRFHRHDIENIATALSILDAPEACLRALSVIKGQPLTQDL